MSPSSARTPVHYRRTAESDAETLSALLRSVAARFVVPDFAAGAGERFLAETGPEAIVELQRAGGFCFSANAGDECVGMIGVRDNSHIKYLFVAGDWHGRGIGRHLVALAVAEMRANGHVGPVTVNSSDFAIEVYRRLGFRPTEPRQERNGIVFTPMQLAS